jgi:hypothetical protein
LPPLRGSSFSNMAGWPDKQLRHPEIARRSLIAWPGYQSGVKVDELDRRVVGTIAKPLAHAVHDSVPVTSALERGMGVMLPAQAWRNQLPLDHPKRKGAFRSLDIHRPQFILEPNAVAFAADFAERYAADHLDAELGAGATIATTPAHVLETEGSVGRTTDLLLARLTAEEFAARRAAAPGPSRPAHETRELYATMIVQASHAIDPLIVDALVTAYAALEGVSGYLIIAANCKGAGNQVAAFASLALRLQDLTGRPAVTYGLGDTHLAFLASGVSATCAGVHAMSFEYPPAAFDELEKDGEDEEEQGLGIYTYHPAILGNVGRLGAEGESARMAIFENRPCRCGHHPANRPPKKKGEIVRHNASTVAADARSFTADEIPVAEHKLLARAQNAERMRSFLKLSKLKRGFLTVSAEARRLRGEHEAARGEIS